MYATFALQYGQSGKLTALNLVIVIILLYFTVAQNQPEVLRLSVLRLCQQKESPVRSCRANAAYLHSEIISRITRAAPAWAWGQALRRVCTYRGETSRAILDNEDSK